MPDFRIYWRSGATLAAIVAGLVLVISLVSAQQTGQPAPTTSDAEAGPAPISATDIPRSAEMIRSRIREIEAGLEVDPRNVNAVREGLPALTSEVEEMFADPLLTNLAELSSRDLQSRRQPWVAMRDRILESETALQDHVAQLDSQRQELRDARTLWEVTELDAEEQDFPQALHESIDQVRDDIEQSIDRVRDRQGDYVSIQNQLSEKEAIVESMIADIDQAILRKQQRIFRPDSPPLWAVFAASDEERLPPLEYARESWSRTLDEALQYFLQNYWSVLLHLVVFILLAVFISSTKERREAQIAVDPEYAKKTRSFDSPLSGAFVVALVAAQFVYEDPPRGFNAIMVLLSLPPLARALPNIMPEFLHRTARVVVGLFAIFVIREISLDATLFDRIILLLLTGLGLWFLLSRFRFYRGMKAKLSLPQDEREEIDPVVIQFSYSRLLQWSLRVAMAIIVLSIIANVVGSVEFADTLTRGLITATFVISLLYVSWDVLTATWRVFLRTQIAQSLNSVRRHRERIRDSGLFVLKWGAIIAAGLIVLSAFGLSVASKEIATTMLDASLQVGAIDISVRAVFVFVVVIWLTLFVARVAKALLAEDILVRMRLPRGVPATVSTLVNYTILAVGFVIAFAAAGIGLGNLTILAGALGVGIGFGLQNIVNNFVSGLILVFERPIQVGDWIQLTNVTGTVRRIGIRASTVRTFDGAEVIVPNGNLISSEVINWTLSDKERRIEIPVGVAYGTDPNRVIDLLTEAIGKHEAVMSEPEPRVLFVGFGQSSLDFLVRCWTPDSDLFMVTKSAICVIINDVLKANGIEIPFPQRDLHLRSVAEKAGDELARGSD